MIKRTLSLLYGSLRYDYIFLFRIPGLRMKEKLHFIAKKYFRFFKDVMSGDLLETRFASVFGKRFYYNDVFGLTSLQRVYCEHYGLKKHASENSIIIDVGAHIGQFNLFCSHYLRAKRIISIEPLIPCFNLLKMNAWEPNDCINKAVSESKAGLTIYISKTSTQMSTSIKSSHNTYEEQVEIPTITLDEVAKVSGTGRVDLLKIDTVRK
jgi:FkbM family methyltransferase